MMCDGFREVDVVRRKIFVVLTVESNGMVV